VPRKKQEPIDTATAKRIGGLLRGLRRAAGYRAVKDAAVQPGCPAAQQTIYAYERGGLVPSLRQFMELVEFYALASPNAGPEARYMGVAAMISALSSPAYHIPEAFDLIDRLQPPPTAGRRRRVAGSDRPA
jgi:hypothetical protein